MASWCWRITAKLRLNGGQVGQKNIDMLLSRAEIEQEFSGFEIVLSRELEREMIEGRFHTGLASVVQFIGRKRAD